MNFIFDPSLALYLPLYELEGVSFASRDAYGHLATVTGAAGRLNGKYFDGIDDVINCGDNAILRQAIGFTIEAFIKPEDVAADRCILSVPYDDLSPWDGPYVGYSLVISSGAKLHADFNVGGVYGAFDGLATLVADTWYHAAYTFDGTTHILYLNGIEDKRNTQAGSVQFSGTPDLSIGEVSVHWTGGGQFFKGVIGEVRFYTRPLSPLEIEHNYLATKWRYR